MTVKGRAQVITALGLDTARPLASVIARLGPTRPTRGAADNQDSMISFGGGSLSVLVYFVTVL